MAVLWEPEFRAVQGCDITRETLQQSLDSFTVAFLGERTRVTVTGAAPDALVIDAGGRFPLTPGDAVGIELNSDGLIALP